jgi:uncharacterized protein (TIGR03067 family)
MKIRGLMILAVLALVAVDAADADDEKVKKEREQLQGKWRVVAMEINNEKPPEEEAKKMLIVIKDDVLTAHFEDQNRSEEGTIKIDPAVKPKIMDFTFTKGDQKDRKLEGIYELDKDDLKICIKLMGNDRPTEFKGAADTILLVMKREK